MINGGNGKFQLVSLPVEAQMAPIFGIITQDINMDGFTDILLAGNDYSLELVTGRIDASMAFYYWAMKRELLKL